MTDNWDFYFLTVDERPASIYVDLDAKDQAPVTSLPNLAYLRLYMRAPRQDGLSSQEEFDILSAIEDSLTATLTPEGSTDTAYVGRCTTNDRRDFYFYVAREEDWEARVAAALSPYPDYQFETGTRPEPGWDAYFDFLIPGPEDQERIQNRRVCMHLEEHGDALTEAREIDHWAYFPTEAARDAYLGAAAALGYVASLEESGDDGEDQGDDTESTEGSDPAERYCARLRRVDVPGFGNIDEVILPLYRLAREHGGRYDGWETFIVQP
jgi:hypothetical protein